MKNDMLELTGCQMHAGGEEDAAPQVLLTSIALWHELLDLHSIVSPTTSLPAPHPPASQAEETSQCTRLLLSGSQLTEGVHALTRWALVVEVSGGAPTDSMGDDAQLPPLPEGVVTAVPARMEWNAPQTACLEALSALQQALIVAQRQQQQGPDTTGAQHSTTQHVLQQLCAALLGPSASSMVSTTTTTSQPTSTSGSGDPRVGDPGCTLSIQHPPPPRHVRARALYAVSALASCSPHLALAMQTVLPPLLLQLLFQQAGRVVGGTAAGWVAVAQVRCLSACFVLSVM